MKRIRILYLINNLIPGGAQRYMVDTLRSLNGGEYDIRIISLGKGNFFKDETTVEVTELGIEKNDPDIFKLIPLVRIIKEYRPHILHTHLQYADTTGQIFGTFFGIPVIITTIHNSVEWPREKRTILSSIEDMSLTLADRIIAVSPSLVTFLVNKRNADPDKISVLPCGVDLSQFYAASDKRTALRVKYDFNDQMVVLACTAQFRPEKRHDLLLQRFATLKKVAPVPLKLLLIGATGILTDSIPALIEQFGLQNDVVLCGGNRNAVSEYLAASDIYIMHSELEGTSLAVAEAMACGLPVLLPRLQHFTQQATEGEHGYFFDFGSEYDFVSTALQLVNDPALRIKLGSSARAYAMETYGIESHVRKLSAIYNELYDKRVLKKHSMSEA